MAVFFSQISTAAAGTTKYRFLCKEGVIELVELPLNRMRNLRKVVETINSREQNWTASTPEKIKEDLDDLHLKQIPEWVWVFQRVESPVAQVLLLEKRPELSVEEDSKARIQRILLNTLMQNWERIDAHEIAWALKKFPVYLNGEALIKLGDDLDKLGPWSQNLVRRVERKLSVNEKEEWDFSLDLPWNQYDFSSSALYDLIVEKLNGVEEPKAETEFLNDLYDHRDFLTPDDVNEVLKLCYHKGLPRLGISIYFQFSRYFRKHHEDLKMEIAVQKGFAAYARRQLQSFIKDPSQIKTTEVQGLEFLQEFGAEKDALICEDLQKLHPQLSASLNPFFSKLNSTKNKIRQREKDAIEQAKKNSENNNVKDAASDAP